MAVAGLLQVQLVLRRVTLKILYTAQFSSLRLRGIKEGGSLMRRCLCMFFLLGVNQVNSFDLSVKRSYDIRSDYAFSEYLPKRLKKFKRLLECKDSLAQVQQVLEQDPDKESYFFVLTCDEPATFLATSFGDFVIKKKPAQMQIDIFGDDKDCFSRVKTICTQMVATARKGASYLPFRWRWRATDSLGSHVAFVDNFSCRHGNFVIGVGMQVTRIPHYLILKHRVDVLLKYFKKNGFVALADLINTDADQNGFAYIISMEAPNRMIACGSHHELILKTPAQIQQVFDPWCAVRHCDVFKRVHHQVMAARSRDGYSVYFEPDISCANEVKAKIGYVARIKYCGKHFLLGCGYVPFDMPAGMIGYLKKRVTDSQELINEIGLDNAVSVLNKENTPDSYVFIEQVTPPYHVLAHGYAEWTKRGIFSEKSSLSPIVIDTKKLYAQEAVLAKEGGGFMTFLWKKDARQAPVALKVIYLMPLYVKERLYVVGTGYLFD